MTSVLHDAGIGVDRGYLVDRRHRAGPTGGDGDDAGVHCGASPGRPEFGRPGPPRLEQQPDEYANHSMKEKKEQWYCRQDVLGTGQ